MISLEEIILDPDFVTKFLIIRTKGEFVKGRWVQTDIEEIPVYGIATPVSSRDLNQLPEGDRISGLMNFYTIKKEPLYLTRTGVDEGISDQILYDNIYYKLKSVEPWEPFGYWHAIGERTKGA
jgi:hypothetical protein